jgi:bacteriocin-like protein
MERSDKAVLSDTELESVSGGAIFSVETQQRIALQQRLTDAYLSSHPVELGPRYLLDR